MPGQVTRRMEAIRLELRQVRDILQFANVVFAFYASEHLCLL